MHPMTQTVLLAFIFFARCASPSNECPPNQRISCESQRSSRGYTYSVPESDILRAGNCEHGWYYQNGTFIVDSTPNSNGNRLPVVVDVTPRNLTMSVCESLQWQLDCDKEKFKCFIDYTVTDLNLSGTPDPLLGNDTHVEEKDANHKDLPAWGIVLIVIAVVGAFITIILIGIRGKLVFNHRAKETKPTDML